MRGNFRKRKNSTAAFYGYNQINLKLTIIYDREVYVQYYENHNNQVKEYFKNRSADLLVLNVEEPDAMERLLKFLGYPYTGQKMPHMNASKE